MVPAPQEPGQTQHAHQVLREHVGPREPCISPCVHREASTLIIMRELFIRFVDLIFNLIRFLISLQIIFSSQVEIYILFMYIYLWTSVSVAGERNEIISPSAHLPSICSAR